MPKDIKNITQEIMKKIDAGEIKMKPKAYFIAGSILTFLGVVFATVTSTFLISLVRFSLRARGKLAQYKLEQLVDNFPWWTLVLAVLSLILGIWLIRKYRFSYKTKPRLIITGFILVIIISGWLIDLSGFTEIVHQRGPMKGIMRNYIPAERIQ